MMSYYIKHYSRKMKFQKRAEKKNNKKMKNEIEFREREL